MSSNSPEQKQPYGHIAEMLVGLASSSCMAGSQDHPFVLNGDREGVHATLILMKAMSSSTNPIHVQIGEDPTIVKITAQTNSAGDYALPDMEALEKTGIKKIMAQAMGLDEGQHIIEALSKIPYEKLTQPLAAMVQEFEKNRAQKSEGLTEAAKGSKRASLEQQLSLGVMGVSPKPSSAGPNSGAPSTPVNPSTVAGRQGS